MNKEKLISLINNPTNISNEDLEALKKLADEYPYFQIAHTLIAKTLGDNKSLAFKNRLHYASITSPDRNILKKVIEGHAISYATSSAIENPIKEELAINTPKEEIKETESSADIVKERLAEIKGTKVEENLSDIAIPAASSTGTVKLSDSTEDNKLINELEENLKSLKEAKERNVAEAKIKRPVKSETISKVASTPKTKTDRKKVGAVQKKATTAKKTTEKSKIAVNKKPTLAKRAAKKVTTAKKTVNKVAKSKTTPIRKTAAKKTTPKKVAVRKVAAIKKVAAVKVSPKKAAAKKTVTTKKNSSPKASAKKTPPVKAKKTTAVAAKKKRLKKTSSNKKVTAQKKIIDDFIKKEPKIRPKKPSLKVKEKPQKDLSVESTKIKNDLVSENLAIIMEKQGKISKAKDIYKKLIWKFPQKKAYFATRIKELDKK